MNDNYFYADVSYAAGVEPKDNNGNICGEAIEAGNIISEPFVIMGTYPYFGTTGVNNELVQQPLVSWSNNFINSEPMSLHSHMKSVPSVIKIPRVLQKMKMYNTLADKYVDVDFSEWVHTTEDIILSTGIEHEYHVYTYTGCNRGTVNIILTF